MDILTFIVGAGVLVAVVLLWFLLSYWLSPHVDSPSGKARVTGSCGDTMEIALKFQNDRVAETAYWTNGCAYSFNCIYAAAELAKGKTPDEILEIDPEMIRDSVGGLPETQMHCARLSVETLQAALDDFMRKSTTTKSPSPVSPPPSSAVAPLRRTVTRGGEGGYRTVSQETREG